MSIALLREISGGLVTDSGVNLYSYMSVGVISSKGNQNELNVRDNFPSL